MRECGDDADPGQRLGDPVRIPREQDDGETDEGEGAEDKATPQAAALPSLASAPLVSGAPVPSIVTSRLWRVS